MAMKKFKDRSPELLDRHVADIVSCTELFKREFGLDLYITGGTLLGAVRGGDFVPDDNDIDIAYMSEFSTPSDVISEWKRVLDMLVSYGCTEIENKYLCKMHFWYTGNLSRFDAAATWISDDRYYSRTYVCGNIDSSHILPLTKIKLRGVEVNAPKNPVALFEYWYGKSWMIPSSAPYCHTKVHKDNRTKLGEMLSESTRHE